MWKVWLPVALLLGGGGGVGGLAGLLPAAKAAETAKTPSIDELLASIDKNLTYDSREVTMTMTVTRSGRTKVTKLHSYGRGADEAATEVLEPARDKGTKMLKKGNEMWLYMPTVEKAQKLSGHMLRQGMLGSDVSYEDMMQASSWKQSYTGKVLGVEPMDGRPCWKIELIAKTPDVTYAKRVIWLDQANYLPLRQELYATSGMLLKTWTMSDIVTIEGKQFARKMVVEDKLQQGSTTTLQFESVDFSVAVPEEIFSNRWLER